MIDYGLQITTKVSDTDKAFESKVKVKYANTLLICLAARNTNSSFIVWWRVSLYIAMITHGLQIKTKFSDTDMTLESKVKVTDT